MDAQTRLNRPPHVAGATSGEIIDEYASILREKLRTLSEALFSPDSIKTLRRFTSGEAAKIIGVTDNRLRQLSLAGNGPLPQVSPTGRRSYTLADIHGLRAHMTEISRTGRTYKPWREKHEHLQVVSVVNFKGGSGKTTTAAHLAQSLVLRGYRVLAIDLDPQSSLSVLHGIQPEIDVGANETLYGALRYGPERRPIADIIRPTYFSGLDLIPGNLELMEFEHETPKALNRRDDSDQLFFERLSYALQTVEDRYDVVVIDCPPQLGFLTLAALYAATSLLITVHPQMLDIASMSQFLTMTGDLLSVVREAGGEIQFDAVRFLITRYEPQDTPQTRVVTLLRHLFGEAVLNATMLKSSAVSDAGLSKQTLYEIGRDSMTRSTYGRAVEALEAVNTEIEGMIRHAWGRA